VTGPLAAKLAVVRGEQARLDAKCSTLAAVNGAVMAVLTSQISRAPAPARFVLAGAGIALAVSAVILLAGVLRPRLGTSGFMAYASMSSEEIEDLFAYEVSSLADDLRFLSCLVRGKQLRLRRAVDLLTAGLVLIGVALIVAVAA
jgi:hypothetical protein